MCLLSWRAPIFSWALYRDGVAAFACLATEFPTAGPFGVQYTRADPVSFVPKKSIFVIVRRSPGPDFDQIFEVPEII